MGDTSDVLDAVVVGLLALLGIGWIIASLAVTLGGGLFLTVPGLLIGIILLYIAIGLFYRKPEAWGIGVAITALMLAWGAVAVAVSRNLSSSEDFLALLTEAGVLGYLLIRRGRFGVGRTAEDARPSG